MRPTLFVAILSIAAPALAPAQTPSTTAPSPVLLAVGQRVNLCEAGLIAPCPVSYFVCDEPRIATIEHGKDGAELVGMSAGATRCLVHGYEGSSSRTFVVTVQARKAP